MAYFAFGWPRVFRAGSCAKDSILDLKYSGSRELLAAITTSCIYVWSGGQHRILLACIQNIPRPSIHNQQPHHHPSAVDGGAPSPMPAALMAAGGNSQVTAYGNVQLEWSHDERSLAICNALGFIQFFSVTQDDTDMLKFEFRRRHTPSDMAAGRNLGYVHLHHVHTFMAPHSGAVSIASDGHVILVATKGRFLVLCNFRGQILDQAPLASLLAPLQAQFEAYAQQQQQQQQQNDDQREPLSPSEQAAKLLLAPEGSALSRVAIRSVALTERFMGVVLDDGAVVAFTRPSTTYLGDVDDLASVATTRKRSFFARCTPNLIVPAGGTCLAFNHTYHVLAIGLESGEVSLHQLPYKHAAAAGHSAPSPASTPPTDSPRRDTDWALLRMLSLIHWSITAESTGSVSQLSWTPDGRALAVGWSERGLSVWSLYGCRLMCSIPQLDGAVSAAQRSSEFAAASTVDRRSSASPRPDSPATPLGTSNNTTSSSSSFDVPSPSASPSVLADLATTPPRGSDRELFRFGVRTMAWGAEAYHLVAAGNGPPASVVIGGSLTTMPPPSQQYPSPPLRVSFDNDMLEDEATSDEASSSHGAAERMPESAFNADDDVGPNVLVQLSFAKSSLVNSPNLSYANQLVLQTENELLLLRKQGRQLHLIDWTHVPIPHVYLADNWPVRLVSLHRRTGHLLAAGTRGFVVYQPLSKRWRMFGDRNHEQSIRCVCACWHYDLLAIVNEIVHSAGSSSSSSSSSVSTSSSFELLLYDSDYLNADSVVLRITLNELSSTNSRARPTLLDSSGQHLFLLTDEGKLHRYTLELPNAANVVPVGAHPLELFADRSVRLVAAHVLELRMPHAPPPVCVLPLHRHADSTPQASDGGFAGTNCLVLQADGSLSIVSLKTGAQTYIASSIEQVWFGGTLDPRHSSLARAAQQATLSLQQQQQHHLYNSLWAYGELGIQVWYPFLSDQVDLSQTRLVSRDRALDFDFEVYPVGFVSELGVIVGLTQGVELSCCSRFPRFVIQTRSHPFLHCILQSLLEKERELEAFQVALRYSSIPHFTHSLELLLHDTLEDEEFGRTNRRGVSNTSALRQALAFLRRFAQFAEVAVRCARKTDVRLWPKLFSFAGQPRDLFHECMDRHQYHVASLYLRVLLNIDGLEFARRSACTVLSAVLENENFELVADLLRFLEPGTYGAATTNEFSDGINNIIMTPPPPPPPQQEISDVTLTSSDSTSATLDLTFSSGSADEAAAQSSSAAQDTYIVDLLLSRYVRKLLSTRQMRLLVAFSNQTTIPLRHWLVQERLRAAALAADELGAALLAVHQQFAIPFPSALLPNRVPLRLTLPADVVQQYASRTDSSDGGSFLEGSSLAASTDDGDLAFQLDSPTKSSAGDANSAPMWRKMIHMLLQEMWHSQCVAWSLVLATILMDLRLIAMILDRHHEALWSGYSTLLRSHFAEGYQELYQHLLEAKARQRAAGKNKA